MMENKILENISEGKPPAAGAGRPKGSPNKITAELKEMILKALDEAGGVEYLTVQAHDNPNAFLSLIGKVLPMTLKHSGDVGLSVNIITGIARDDT